MKLPYVLILSSIVPLTVILAIYFYSYFSIFQPATVVQHSRGKNAMWLRHQWVGDNHSEEEYQKLNELFKQHEITDAFFHVGPLNTEGRIEPEKYQYAKKLVSSLRTHYPNLHIQAWIGQVEKRGGGILDVSDESVRKNIVITGTEFLDMGFDGIHYNIEPIYSGDKQILELLQKTKQVTLQRNKILSIASDELEPFPNADKFIRPFTKQAGFWSKEYYREVGTTVDQIAVMMYDSALPKKEFFSNLVAWETRNIINTLDNNTTLFMGVATYEEDRWVSKPEVENITSGILGIQKGIENMPSEELKNFGLALYAEWTTDEKEWQDYRTLWLGYEKMESENKNRTFE